MWRFDVKIFKNKRIRWKMNTNLVYPLHHFLPNLKFRVVWTHFDWFWNFSILAYPPITKIARNVFKHTETIIVYDTGSFRPVLGSLGPIYITNMINRAPLPVQMIVRQKKKKKTNKKVIFFARVRVIDIYKYTK